MEFIKLAYVGDIDIYMHVNGYASFFSSPYTPHINGAAVDLSNSTEFGDEALSPISGYVEDIRKVDVPLGRYNPTDYVIAIKLKGSRFMAKLMHVNPTVSIGEHIDVGDPLGRYLRSNYFSYHHIPHIHLEICRDSSLRPSRAVKLTFNNELFNGMTIAQDLINNRSLVIKVNEIHGGFILGSISGSLTLGMLCRTSKGSVGMINGQLGLGLDYMGYIHVVGKPYVNEKIILTSTHVGYIKRIGRWYSLTLPDFHVSFNRWLSNRANLLNLITGFANSFKGLIITIKEKNLNIVGVEFLISSKAQVKLVLPESEVSECGLREGELLSLTIKRTNLR